jgi:thioesterase domain-containing protein
MGEDLDRLVPLRTGAGGAPLYCVHAVSGSPYSYAGLARLISPDVSVVGIEAPGFDNDREPVRSIPALADEYTALLRAAQPTGGYRLLGWSLGGVLVFEMAKRLSAEGARVDTLVLVDAGLPQVMQLPPERQVLRRYVRDIMGSSDHTPTALDVVLAGHPDDVDPAVVFAAVTRAGILPEEIDEDVLARQYAVFRAHLAAFYSVEVSGRYDGPAVHILAAASPAEDMRWDRLIPALTTYTVPGTHHSMWHGDGLAAIARIVRATIAG